jgi:thymidylate synthase
VYLPIESQQSNARAWLAAATEVQKAGGQAYNVVIDIADPAGVDDVDTAIMNHIDQFLRTHNVNGLVGVANTIFPLSTLRQHGADAFYEVYRERVLPRMKKMTRDWGRYFDRLTAWKKVKGNKIEIINPLDELVSFMRNQISSARTYRNAYEMTVYDPGRDAGKVSNRQCLSFLSFKLTEDNHLLLTVMYRNHAYIARGLGNFIGLGRLQAFVADQAGAKMGSLTCISTHAEIDHSTRDRDGMAEGWTRKEANQLLDECRGFLHPPTTLPHRTTAQT